MKFLSILLILILLTNQSYTQDVNIPNEDLLESLIENGVDINDDGIIQLAEAEAQDTLDLRFDSNEELTGLEAFTNLKTLYFRNERIRKIDSFPMPKLETLFCDAYFLNELSVQNLNKLEYLTVESTRLLELDISQNVKLIEFTAKGTEVEFYDFSPHTLLERLTLVGPHIDEIDLSNNTLITDLTITNTGIREIDLSNQRSLLKLDLSWNSLRSLDLSANPEITEINVSLNGSLSELEISNNNKLQSINIFNIDLDKIDLSPFPELRGFTCGGNKLTEVDITKNSKLVGFDLRNSDIESVDFSQNPLLRSLRLIDNRIQTLDLNANKELFTLEIEDFFLEVVLLKNGLTRLSTFFQSEVPNLRYMCVEESDAERIAAQMSVRFLNIEVNYYCAFGSGEYFMDGQSRSGTNSNCDMDINNVMLYSIMDEQGNEELQASPTSAYKFSLPQDTFTVRPVLDNPSLFNISPPFSRADFNIDSSPFVQDFCITPISEQKDLSIKFIPLESARPGFSSEYKIIYSNNGSTIESGEIQLSFEENKMAFTEADQAPSDIDVNRITWNFDNLNLFESREIIVDFLLNTPTDPNPLMQGDKLNFITQISESDDINLTDNSSMVNHCVVNSFDPNDKVCLQGPLVSDSLIGQYVDYRIRFENTGTAAAINVVIRDELDTTRFDSKTLKFIDSSHPVNMRLKDNHILEFVYQDIQLPFDDNNNDGYVVFSIQTLATITVKDSLINEAGIYFDFNSPIVTEEAQTLFDQPSSLNPIIEENSLIIFPNPIDKVINVVSTGFGLIHIVDIQGRIVAGFDKDAFVQKYDISHLNKGLYFLNLTDTTGITQTCKFVKL